MLRLCVGAAGFGIERVGMKRDYKKAVLPDDFRDDAWRVGVALLFTSLVI